MASAFRFDELDGKIGLVTFDLPEKKVNTLSQEVLKELGGLLPSSSREATVREQISIELMVLFVLIDCFRPERLRESGWNPDAGVEEVIRERVESLVLDVINIRERLK